jgi:hypothetical protein
VPPKNKNIPDRVEPSSSPFISWKADDSESIKAAQAEMGKAYASINPIVRRSKASQIAPFSVRHGMDRPSYEAFRPDERLPRMRSEILSACTHAYHRVSPIKNIFDMMTDFTIEGIRLVHPNSQVQQFFQNWFKHVNGVDRSEHFVGDFFLNGTVIGKRTLGQLSARVVNDLQRGLASAADSDVYDIKPDPKPRQPRNVIPWSYDFIDPRLVSLLGNELSAFINKPRYGIMVPPQVAYLIKNPKSAEDKMTVGDLPAYIFDAIKAGSTVIPIAEDRLVIAHYKKKDWEAWASPILLSIMDDIILLQKMKLADLAALDGAISHIRIWQLGSLEHHIAPTEAGFNKLSEALQFAGNGESFDLMWGPELTLKETTTDIQKYLGEAKYKPVYSSLYAGLGVPPSLVGGTGGETGFTNNALSLKTLVERLNCGRRALVNFWDNEIKLVQQAFQFRFPAQVEFKHAVLTDEASFQSMLIDLLDRDVISVERVRDHLGYIPDIEDSLVKYEWKARKGKKMPPKASPFHDPDQDYGFKKIFAQLGAVTPTEVGVELDDAKRGEKTPLEQKVALQPKIPKTGTSPQIEPPAQNPTIKKVGQQGEGRPPGSKDTTPRKTKQVRPRTRGEELDTEGGSTFINLVLFAKDAQQAISEIVNPVFVKQCNKSNMRQLSNVEAERLEHFKFTLLCNIPPYEAINQKSVGELMQKPLALDDEAANLWRSLVSNFIKMRGAVPTVEDVRQIQNHIYALYNIGD